MKKKLKELLGAHQMRDGRVVSFFRRIGLRSLRETSRGLKSWKSCASQGKDSVQLLVGHLGG